MRGHQKQGKEIKRSDLEIQHMNDIIYNLRVTLDNINFLKLVGPQDQRFP